MDKMEENSENVPIGQVIRQDPEANTGLVKGSTVSVSISIGPEEKPPVFHSVTFTVRYEPLEPIEEENEEEEPLDPQDPIEQKVTIYIDDMNNNITEVYKEDYITKDTDYTIRLTIEPNKTASYKVMRDDVVYETKSFEEGE